uniref:non-specific serine/threonine protein kinase n=1 Tax=Amphilophus citrinellus TaxID=61819 RepID=A0A3Q0RYB8_AMPCI
MTPTKLLLPLSPVTKLVHIKHDNKAKYLELDLLGEGGVGAVYAGRRKADNLPVSITYIFLDLMHTTCSVPFEVLVIKAGIGASSEEKSAAVLILDWYELEEEVLLVMERPVPCVNLLKYVEENDGCMKKVFEFGIPVLRTLKMHANGVFHRDIKSENLTSSSSSGMTALLFLCDDFDFSLSLFLILSFCLCRVFIPPELFIHKKCEAQTFVTSKFLYCRNFLELCLTQSPKERGTLEQIQMCPRHHVFSCLCCGQLLPQRSYKSVPAKNKKVH